MLGRRKQRKGSSGSIDMLTAAAAAPPAAESSTAPARAFNFIVERARGAVGLATRDARERTRTTSNGDDGASFVQPSSSPTGSVKSLFGSPSSGAAVAGPSASASEVPANAEGAGTGGAAPFFRRTASSNPSRPAWLMPKDSSRTGSPLTSSPSTPSGLSLAGGSGAGERRRKGSADKGVYAEGGRIMAAMSRSSSDLAHLLAPASSKHFSRSVEDLNFRSRQAPDPPPPVPKLVRHSTDELRRASPPSQVDDSLSPPPPLRNKRSSSLTPGITFTSPPPPNLLSTSAPSSHASHIPPLVPQGSPRPSNSNSNPNSNSNSPIPFPTSTSTPNFPSPAPFTSSSDSNRRRDSQTVLAEGFLQRKSDYAPLSAPKHHHSHSFPALSSPAGLSPSPHHPHASATSPQLSKPEIDLQKGWKPFRATLKGSKLYLHKVPGDLSTTAKHLFPSTIVEKPPAPSPGLHSPASFGDGFEEEGSKRKPRVFWGTGATSHPGLVLPGGEKRKGREAVKGGTLEALAHELVFGTTFIATSPSETTTEVADQAEEEAERLYDEFLETVLLFAPSLGFPSPQFASELDRCVSLAVRSALEAAGKDPVDSFPPERTGKALAERLDKVVRTICERYPADLRGPSNEAGASVWKSALDVLTRQIATLSGAEEVRGDRKSLEEVVFDACAGSTSPAGTPVTEWPPAGIRSSNQRPLTSVSNSPTKTRKRLPPEPDLAAYMSATAFLATEPTAFAAQVHFFHLDRLAALSNGTSRARHVLRAASTFLVADAALRATALTPLFSFTSSSPHFLTRVVLNTILPGGSGPVAVTSPNLFGPTPSNHELRAKIITRWIGVGEELKRRGDATGWAAVASALCSRSVARLQETWRIVEPDLVETVRRAWALTLARMGFADLDNASIQPLAFPAPEENTAVPYLGSILEEASSALRLARAPPEEFQSGAVSLAPLYPLLPKLREVDDSWSTAKPVPLKDVRPEPELQLFFQYMSRAPPPARPQLSAYLTVSVQVEPRPPAQHLSLHFKSRPVTEPSPLIPLLMVEPLPHITLVDRDKIIQSAAGALPRKQSGTSLTSIPAAVPSKVEPGRLTRHNSYPPSATSNTERSGIFSRLRSEIAHPSETLLRFADGDIVFRIISVALPSVPAASPSNEMGVLSRTSSWIESRSSHTSTRSSRASMASLRDRSPLLPSSSRHESSPVSSRNLETQPKLQVAGEEEPVHVVVKAGTVESLVDLLVLGIGNLRMPTKDADGESSLTGKRPLALDAEEYRSSFFATFRAFSSPLAILDMLRKRYLAAPNASREYVNLSSARPFPSWSMAPSTETDDLDWTRIAAIRLDVLGNIRHWVEHQITDFLDDDDLYTSTATFLSFVEMTEQLALDERPKSDDAVLETAKWIRVRFSRSSLRPVVRARQAVIGAPPAKSGRSVPLSFDALTATELVDRLDLIACHVTQDVTEHDVLRYLDVLEASTLADPAAWYSSRQLVKTDDDEIVIVDPYSQLNGMAGDPTFVKSMPQSLQYGLKAQATLRRWILSHLVDPELSLKPRQARMLKALEIVEICRSRMSNVFFGGQPEIQTRMLDPSLASFVERATTAAIVSPESRLFASAWAGVAALRQGSPDTLASLVKPKLVMTDATATLDLAWLNERLLEITTQVDSLAEGMAINFDKRRWIFNCIRNALAIRPAQAPGRDDLELMERQLADGGMGRWNFRLFRDVASGEGNKLTKSVRPFRRLVEQQQEKVRRDRQTRDYVSKGQKAEQQSRLQREKEVARAMDKSVSVRTRRMTLNPFRVARPVSTVVPSPPLPPSSPSVAALQALREWNPTAKPYLVLSLSGVEVHPYDNGQRSYVFELFTEDGQRSLFQASSHEELQMWISNFRQSKTQIAFRRATFLAQSPLAEEPEEPVALTKQSQGAKLTSKTIFQVSLDELSKREGSSIPKLLEITLQIVEERGLAEVGIYRISGENKLIHDTKDKLDRGGDPATLLTFDVHNVTGLVKMFLRELPEPLIPFNLYSAFIAANGIEDYDDRLYAIRDLVWKLPTPNFQLLRRLTEHLDRVTDNEEVNSMHAANLSIIFAPTLLKPPPGPASFSLSMGNLGKAANLIKSLILQQHWLFAEELDEPVVDTPIETPQDEQEQEILEDSVIGLGVSGVDIEGAVSADSEAVAADEGEKSSDAGGSDQFLVADEDADAVAIEDYPLPHTAKGERVDELDLDLGLDAEDVSTKSGDGEKDAVAPTTVYPALTPLSIPSPTTNVFPDFMMISP